MKTPPMGTHSATSEVMTTRSKTEVEPVSFLVVGRGVPDNSTKIAECANCERGVVDQRARLLCGEARRVCSSEPIHIEDEVTDQEGEVADGRDCEDCKVESRREIKHTGA